MIVVSTAADTRSKQKNQEENRQKSHGLFKDVLQAEEKRFENRQESVCTLNSYSKDARPVHYEIRSHAYN